MSTRVARWLAILALLACGCAHTIRVATPPPGSPAPARLAGPPVVIDTVSVRTDGAPMNVSDELLLLVANRLRKSGLFASVYEPAVSHEAPPEALRLSLEVLQTDHPEPVATGMLKALFVMASVHLLAPVLPFQYGYEAELEATFEAGDGSLRSYRSRAEGSVRYPMTFSDPRRAGIETRSAVLDRALELLMHAVASDSSFGGEPTAD